MNPRMFQELIYEIANMLIKCNELMRTEKFKFFNRIEKFLENFIFFQKKR